jgi:hypothetical protein
MTASRSYQGWLDIPHSGSHTALVMYTHTCKGPHHPPLQSSSWASPHTFSTSSSYLEWKHDMHSWLPCVFALQMDGPDPESASMAPDSHWASVIEQLNLSEEQVCATAGWA